MVELVGAVDVSCGWVNSVLLGELSFEFTRLKNRIKIENANFAFGNFTYIKAVKQTAQIKSQMNKAYKLVYLVLLICSINSILALPPFVISQFLVLLFMS